MSWTAMSDLSAGDIVTEADMDALRGNISYLLAPPTDTVDYDKSADYTTTSATFVDVDATNLSMSITTAGGPILIGAEFITKNSIAAAVFGFQFDVSGVSVGTLGPTGVAGIVERSVTLTALYTPPSAAAYTIKLQWRSDGASTQTIYSNGENVKMWVIEL